MISFKTIVVIMLGATHCSAQEINIRGIVKDTSGIGISGAIVSLENAKITTMTGADGIFTLRASCQSSQLQSQTQWSQAQFRYNMVRFPTPNRLRRPYKK